jgi:RNA polymerase sigma-70 factor, ECF subfamily
VNTSAGRQEPDDAWARGWPQSRDEFAALVEAFSDRLVRHAFRRLGSLPDAEDVVQDVFVRAFADQSKRSQVAAVGAYLFRSVANACTDLQRKRNCAAVYREEIDAEQLLGLSGGSSEVSQSREELRRVQALLGQLPEEQAEAVRLRVLDGLRLKEIAEVLGCPLNTVCSRLRYGFQKLRSLVTARQE